MAEVRFGEVLLSLVRIALFFNYFIMILDICTHLSLFGLSRRSSILCLASSRNDLFDGLVILPTRSFEANERLNMLDRRERILNEGGNRIASKERSKLD
jgi:hypothetical protein